MTLELYLIYDHPRDFPTHFVVRRWVVEGGSELVDLRPHATVATLEEARASLPAGLTNIGRWQNDDPVITEVWV